MANDTILETSDLQTQPGDDFASFAWASAAADRSSGEAVLQYYIDPTADTQTLGQGSTVESLVSSPAEKTYITETIDYINQWIDLDMVECCDPAAAYLDVYKVKAVDGIDDNIIGQVQRGSGLDVELQWEDAGNSDQLNFWEKRVITHELTHVIGLRHPNGDGSNPNFDSSETCLSYNSYNTVWAYKLTAMDILALVELWGPENETAGLSLHGTSSDDVITVNTSNSVGNEYGGVQRIEAGAGDDMFITDLSIGQASQSGSILLGMGGEDTARFILPDPDSSNPLLWLDIYCCAALNASILQTTLTNGDYYTSLTDSEVIEFNFDTSTGEQIIKLFFNGSNYERTNYADMIGPPLVMATPPVMAPPPVLAPPPVMALPPLKSLPPVIKSSPPVIPVSSPETNPAPAPTTGAGAGGGGSPAPAVPTQPVVSRSDPPSNPALPSVTPEVNSPPPSVSVLIGVNSSDPLIGDSGANTLVSGIGAFTLSGGAGADAFVFRSRERLSLTNADQITDFNPAEGDKIILSSSAFQGLERIKYRAVSSAQKLKKQSHIKSNLLYIATDQSLNYDANGSKKGFGVEGGPFAILCNGACPDSSCFMIDHQA